MLHPLLSHCAELVRAHDHDRYLCTLFAPGDVREAWFAIFAFNHELAVIPELASEEMLAFIRFAWWREALDEIYAGKPVRKHPVVQALAVAVDERRLPRAPLEALLDARQARIGAEPFTQLTQWEEYFRATSAGLLALCALASGELPGDALADLGVAWGCIGAARTMERGEDAAMLTQAAAQRLGAAYRLPAILMPFHDAARFYLERLKRRRKTGPETAFLLLLALCWRRLLRY